MAWLDGEKVGKKLLTRGSFWFFDYRHSILEVRCFRVAGEVASLFRTKYLRSGRRRREHLRLQRPWPLTTIDPIGIAIILVRACR